MNNFKIKYGFINQILNICKANAVIVRKMIIMFNFYQYVLKKQKILPKIKNQ